MKYILILIAVASIYGCGDDNTVTNNTNPPPVHTADTVVLVQQDSIYTGTNYSTRDSLYGTLNVTVDTLHGSFTLNSENAKIIYAYVQVTGAIFEVNRTYTVSPADEDIEFTLIVNQSTFIYKVYLQIVEALTPDYRASLKHIKLWYIKRA